jgi:hypothetical protein
VRDVTNPDAANWRDIGPTSAAVYLSEFARVNSILGLHAEAMHAAAGPHSALALAHMWAENKYSTTGIMIQPEHNNPMALRPGPGIEVDYGLVPGPFLTFTTPVDCVREWRRRIEDPSYKSTQYPGGAYASTTTLKEYVYRYNPPGDTHPITGEANNSDAYMNTLLTMMRAYRIAEGVLEPVPQPVPAKEPVMAYEPKQLYMWLHEGRTMGGKWYAGVTRYIWNRNGNTVQGIVHHVQEGSNSGSWEHFHAVKASATVFIGKNGDIWWLVDEKHGPWTNGDVNAPDAFIREMIRLYGPDPNEWTLTIEYEGFTGNLPYTEEQYQSGLWLTRRWMTKYGITDIKRATIRHGQINSVDRAYCCEREGGPFLTRMRKDLAVPAGPVYAKPHNAEALVAVAQLLEPYPGVIYEISNWKLRAIRDTPRLQDWNSDVKVGPDIAKGLEFDAIARAGGMYITKYGTKVREADVEIVT